MKIYGIHYRTLFWLFLIFQFICAILNIAALSTPKWISIGYIQGSLLNCEQGCTFSSYLDESDYFYSLSGSSKETHNAYQTFYHLYTGGIFFIIGSVLSLSFLIAWGYFVVAMLKRKKMQNFALFSGCSSLLILTLFYAVWIRYTNSSLSSCSSNADFQGFPVICAENGPITILVEILLLFLVNACFLAVRNKLNRQMFPERFETSVQILANSDKDRKIMNDLGNAERGKSFTEISMDKNSCLNESYLNRDSSTAGDCLDRDRFVEKNSMAKMIHSKSI